MARYAVPAGHKIIAPARSWAYPLIALKAAIALFIFIVTVVEFAFFIRAQRFALTSPKIVDYEFIVFTNLSNPTIITRERPSSALEIVSAETRYELSQRYVFEDLLSNVTVRYIKAFLTFEASQIVTVRDQLEYYVEFNGTGFDCVIAESIRGKGVEAQLSRPPPVFYDIDEAMYNATPYASASCFSIDAAPIECANTGAPNITLTFEYQTLPGEIVFTNFLAFLLFSAAIVLGAFLAAVWIILSGWVLRQILIMQREHITQRKGFGDAPKLVSTVGRRDFMKKEE